MLLIADAWIISSDDANNKWQFSQSTLVFLLHHFLFTLCLIYAQDGCLFFLLVFFSYPDTRLFRYFFSQCNLTRLLPTSIIIIIVIIIFIIIIIQSMNAPWTLFPLAAYISATAPASVILSRARHIHSSSSLLPRSTWLAQTTLCLTYVRSAAINNLESRIRSMSRCLQRYLRENRSICSTSLMD